MMKKTLTYSKATSLRQFAVGRPAFDRFFALRWGTVFDENMRDRVINEPHI